MGIERENHTQLSSDLLDAQKMLKITKIRIDKHLKMLLQSYGDCCTINIGIAENIKINDFFKNINHDEYEKKLILIKFIEDNCYTRTTQMTLNF